MNLYFARISDVLPRHRDMLSPERRQKVARFKMPDDQKRCIVGGVLIRHFLPHAVITDNGFGKPIADGVGFNLSHSGDWVVLAVSKTVVGCDIERLKPVCYQKMGKIVFTDTEMAVMHCAMDKMTAFYTLWTKKEALLKCIGEGFHRPAKSVDVSGSCFSDGGKTYFLKKIPFADYIVSVCGEDTDFKVKTTLVNLRKIS